MKYKIILILLLLPATLTGRELTDLYKKGKVILNADPDFSLSLEAASADIESEDTDWLNRNISGRDSITDFTISEDGTTYLLEGNNQCVVYKYDKDGNYISMFKPGENSKGLNASSHSIDILDNTHLIVAKYDRILVFTTSGALRQTINLDYSIGKCIALKDGKIAVMGEEILPGEDRKRHVAIIDIRTQKEKTVKDFIEEQKNTHIMFRSDLGDMVGVGNPFRQFNASIDKTEDGDLVVGYSENREIYIFSPDGTQKGQIKLDYPALAITREEKNEYYNEMKARNLRENIKIKIPEEALNVIASPGFFPEHWPYYYDIKVDTDNNILVFKYTKDKDHSFRVYQVYSKDGRFICETTIDPAKFENPDIRQMKFFKGDLYGLFALKNGNTGKELVKISLTDKIRTPDSERREDADEEKDDAFKIKVDVEEVRLDAVVVDGKWRQITDLTADDFKIYQDRKIQEIIACRYISYGQPQPGDRAVPSPGSGTSPPVPASMLKRNEVQRTFVFIVHDYSMSFEEVYRTRMSLRKYVQEQMQPGDLVSIVKTSRGIAVNQAFTSDRQELMARIDSIQWSARWGPDPANQMTHVPQIMAVESSIKALREMPGRKHIMLITPVVGVSKYNPEQNTTYNILADAALRAGVVIHTMDIAGLIANLGSTGPIDGIVDAARNSYSSAIMGGTVSGSSSLINRPTHSEIPLSRVTGGLTLIGFNWFVDGLGPDIREQLKGYYLLSYIPPKNTFSKSGRSRYHWIEIETKRRGATVHTRAGFYGDPAILEVPRTTPSPLVEAMFAPFQYSDLNVSLASGYIDNLSDGYLLPTWMHLDGRDLQVIKQEDGSYSVSFEAGASTTDIDNFFQDYGSMTIKFRVDEEDIQTLRETGIKFSVSIPVKKPGGYYVRVAIRDQLSEAKGSAYQFIEVPDLKKNRLALSSLYIIDREEDASWIRSIATDEPSQPADPSSQISLKSPARKNFRSGDSFEYMAVIYNAKTKKENPPELESQVVLYKNGAEFYQGKAEAIGIDSVTDYKRIPIRKNLHIEDSMQPGDYILQFLVKDKQAKEKESLTAQTLSFRVVAP